jgi:hypothetical protein
MQMSNHRNSIVRKVVANQVQRITQQIKKNSPKPLTSTGAETVITEIPPAGYYINQPGKYVLGNTINWFPPADGSFFAAIVIQCDNVDLDFQGNHLIAANEGNHTSLGVIVLNAENACNNVTVQNGTIQNMGLYGLWAVNTNGLSISQITVEGLTYPNFDFLPSAISLVEAKSFTVGNSHVKNVTANAMLAGGFMILGANKGTVSNCSVDNFTNTDGVACGFPYFDCSGIDTDSCTVTDLTTLYGGNPHSKFGHTCIGFMPAKCTNLSFSGCTATKINGCCDDCHGMSLFLVDGATITNFTASHVYDGLGPQKTGAKATGLEVYGSNIKVTNSHVNDITAIVPQDLQSTGFSACGTNITFDSCTATGITVYNAKGQPDTSNGYGTGFGWAPDPRKHFVNPSKQVTYKNCVANKCQLGFDTWNHEDSTWINPKTTGPGLNHLIQAQGTERVYSMNFCSELPDSDPSSPSKKFPIHNQIGGNTYPNDWNE